MSLSMRPPVNPFRRALPLCLLAILLAPGRVGAADQSLLELETRAFLDTASPDGSVRLAAVPVLGQLWTIHARERLMLMARADGDPRVRASAVRVLATTRDPGFRPLLRSIATNDPDPSVRQEAAGADAQLEAFSRRPRSAAGFSLLCPGCGYFYLRQPKRAAAYLGATGALLGAGVALLAGGGSDPLPGQSGPRREPTTAPLAIPVLNAAQNLYFYSVFATYRDARIRRNDEGYSYPVSREGLTDLVTAPFRPSVLGRPWFWAGLPALFGAAIGFSILVDADEPVQAMRTLAEGDGVWFLGRRYGKKTGFALGESYYAGLFLPVGVGEEALFRGAIQPGLSEMLGLWPGWAVASAIFGAVHAFNFTSQAQGLSIAAKAVPFITATGSYLGLVAIKTGFQLETSVALHFWYDFLLGTAAFLVDPDNQPFAMRFGLPF
jgi:membrane protease YdiL (CAAX protease family)